MLKNQSLALLMLGFPMGARMVPDLRPQGPDQKCTHTTFISEKNWSGGMGSSQPKGWIGREVQWTLVLFYLDLFHVWSTISCICLLKSRGLYECNLSVKCNAWSKWSYVAIDLLDIAKSRPQLQRCVIHQAYITNYSFLKVSFLLLYRTTSLVYFFPNTLVLFWPTG